MALPIKPARGLGHTIEAALRRSALLKAAMGVDKDVMQAVTQLMTEQGLDPKSMAEAEHYAQAMQQVLGPEAYSAHEFMAIAQQMQANYETTRQEQAAAAGSVDTMQDFQVV